MRRRVEGVRDGFVLGLSVRSGLGGGAWARAADGAPRWLFAALLGLAALPAFAGNDPGAAAPEGAEPPLCRQVIEAEPAGDPLYALRRAEQKRAQTARRASRQAKKAMRQTIGGGTTMATRQQVEIAAEHQERFSRAISEATELCGCRQARGDPLRKDCDRLYRRYREPRPRPRTGSSSATGEDPPATSEPGASESPGGPGGD